MHYSRVPYFYVLYSYSEASPCLDQGEHKITPLTHTVLNKNGGDFAYDYTHIFYWLKIAIFFCEFH